MARSVDLRLLRTTAHSPSYFTLTRDYAPGEQSDLVDFCIPCNPYFPTPGMFERLQRNLETILKYYPSDAETITAELCNTLGLQPQTVAMGNGSTELITWIDHLLVRESLAIPIPTFGRWTDQPLETGKRVDMFPLQESEGFRLDVDSYVRFIRSRGSRVAVICNPNNPDGGFVARQEVVRMLDMLNDLDLVVVDESFIDFVDAEPYRSVAEEAAIRPNVIVLKSLGKNFGLHGVRFGYMVSNPALAGVIRKALPKWNLNSFAEVVVFMLKEHQEEYYQSLRLLARDRQLMYEQLSQLPGLTVYPSQGNFLLIKLPDGRDGVELRDYLLSEWGVFVRECGNKLGTTSQFLRLVVRPQPDVQRLLNGLFAYLYGVETLNPPVHQAQQVPHNQQQQVTYQQQRSITAATESPWGSPLAELTGARPMTVADVVGGQPAAAASTGAHRRVGVDTGPMPQVTVSEATIQHPLAVADTGMQQAVTPGAAAGTGTGAGGAGVPGTAAGGTGTFPAAGTGPFPAIGAGSPAGTGPFPAVGSGSPSGTGTFPAVGSGSPASTGPFPAVGSGSPSGTGSFPAVGTGTFAAVNTGAFAAVGGGAGGTAGGTATLSPGSTANGATTAAAQGGSPGADTNTQWPASAVADIAAGRTSATDTGQWPALSAANQTGSAAAPAQADGSAQAAASAQSAQDQAAEQSQNQASASGSGEEKGSGKDPATDPALNTTIPTSTGEIKITETGSWSIPPDLASARARSKGDRSSGSGMGRPTVADVNARSGYGTLGVDDRFALAPKNRDQGPGTDWITVRRR